MGKPSRIMFVIALLVSSVSIGVPVVAQESADRLLFAMQQLDVSDQKLSEQIRIQLEFANQLVRLNKEELADGIQAEMAAKAEREGDPQLYVQLFEHANRLHQFERARSYAEKTESSKTRLAKKLLIEQYRSGDVQALDRSKVKFDDFFSALEMADAMVEVGNYDEASKFVSNVILDNDPNDPRAIAGFTYRNIARKYHEQGDAANAKRFIDKAMDVGGKLYYSGYGIQITKRVIENELTKGLEKFAGRAATYRGHQGRELLSNYAAALYENDFYDEAKQVLQRIDDQDDAEYMLIHLAWHQAKQGRFNGARKTIDEITKPEYRFRAQVFLAIQLIEAGKLKESDVLLNRLEADFDSLKDKNKRLYYSLAYAIGIRNDDAKMQKHLAAQPTDLDKANWILAMLKGITKAEFY